MRLRQGCSYRSTVSRRRDRLRREVGAFLKAYRRTSGRGGNDPNDRHYSRELEAELKRLAPEDLDLLLRDDDDLDAPD